MNITSVHIKHFRCIRDESLPCDGLTVLVGANGVGKSTFLQGLDFFYRVDASIDPEDFFKHDTGSDIEVAVTFSDLSPEATDRFAKYVEDGELSMVRVAHWNGERATISYHGSRLQVAAFRGIRLAGSATNMKPVYEAVQKSGEFAGLPQWRSQPQALEALDEWENTNPSGCERLRDEGTFFGFKEVAVGYLGQYTRFVLVPAVRDAALDAAEGRSSLFTTLIDLVVRNSTTGDDDLLALADETKTKYAEIVATSKDSGLRRLEQELTAALGDYVTASDVTLSWEPMPPVSLATPKVVAKIGEDGHRSGIERKGHGLQRAFVMALLQYLEQARSGSAAGGHLPAIILGIEEPELYQHPDRQRHMAKVLRNLTSVESVERGATQVIYCTHSPHFVGLDRFDNIRVARKTIVEPGEPPSTKLSRATLANVALQLEHLCQRDPESFSGESLRLRLHTVMTPWMNEGFFAKLIVLTEGESDRAALLAAAAQVGVDFESQGITVIPCGGKTNIDRVALIFHALAIDTYIVWDSDQGQEDPKPDLNRRLLRLVGLPEEDYPSFVGDRAAAFLIDIETTLKEDIGEPYGALVSQLRIDFELGRDDVLKNPTAMMELLRRASDAGKTATTIEAIVTKVTTLRGNLV